MSWLNKSDAEVIAAINKLSEYEADGYRLTWLRDQKNSMLDFPEKAKQAFEIKDFALTIWPDFEADFKKLPLTHLGQFFYSDSKTVEQFAKNQICSLNMSIASDRKYIAGLGKSKSDKKSIAFAESLISDRYKQISLIENKFKEYSQNPQPMNNEQLKADKVRVLADLNCIKNEYISDPDFALENLDMLGFDIDKKGKITIKTPGGYFKFMIERIDQITELVEMHYPEDLENTLTNSCQDNEDEIQDALTEARHNLKEATKAKNIGLMNLFLCELDKLNTRKDALIYA